MLKIDLHGKNQFETKVFMQSFLKECTIKRLKYASICHGNGEYIVRGIVIKELQNNKYVKTYTFAPPYLGGSGITIVTFDYNIK